MGHTYYKDDLMAYALYILILFALNPDISSGERGYTGPMMVSLGTLTNIIHNMVDGSDVRADFN